MAGALPSVALRLSEPITGCIAQPHCNPESIQRQPDSGHALRSSIYLPLTGRWHNQTQEEISHEQRGQFQCARQVRRRPSTLEISRRFDEVVASDCVDHDPAPGQVPGPEGYRMFFTQMRTAFPDLSVSPDTVVADDESIAFRLYPHRDPQWGR